MQSEQLLTKGLIRKTELCKRLGITPGGLDKLRARDTTFPKPLKEGASRQAAAYYVVVEVEAWLQSKVAERDAQHGAAA